MQVDPTWIPPVDTARPVPGMTSNFAPRGRHQDGIDAQQARHMPVDPGDLAARLARHKSLFGEVLAPVAPMQHPPVDPLRQWYNDWNSPGPANRWDAPTRLDDFRYRGISYEALQTLGHGFHTHVPSFSSTMLASSHAARPPQVGDMTADFRGLAAFQTAQQ